MPHTRLRSQLLTAALDERVLVLDGAMGTAIQDQGLSPEDFGAPAANGCNEVLVVTRPDVISRIHSDYLEAGCDIIETNTFGATPLVLREFGLASKCRDINFNAARIAREVASDFSEAGKPRFVAGSIGPTTRSISVTGGISFDELKSHFHAQALGLIDGGVDYLLLETCQDTRNTKAAVLGVQQAMHELRRELPIAISCTLQPGGALLAGQKTDAFLASISHLDLLYLGLNCATGPEGMQHPLELLSRLANTRVACVPNAGLPGPDGKYPESAVRFAESMREYLNRGWLNVVGGCCGTGVAHIRALSELSSCFQTRAVPKIRHSSRLAGIDLLELTDQVRPILVGERTNVTGSRKFRDLITDRKFEEASELARTQVGAGARIIDICLSNPERDELADMKEFMQHAAQRVRVPLMIDSLDPKVIEAALTYCQGKALINSVNLEDGGSRLRRVATLAREYGAALVVGCIDDDPKAGMAFTRGRKLAIAARTFDLLTEQCGIPAEDLYFDPLVFPCGTDASVNLAVETIEGLRLIKNRFPVSKTLLGISNISFGLPASGREVLNSVFLHQAVQAGLDLAIVNPQAITPYGTLSETERELAENLLFHAGDDAIRAFSAAFRGRRAEPAGQTAFGSPEERITRCVIEGSQSGLFEAIQEMLKSHEPAQIIEGPLMRGMDQVGTLFKDNQLIIAEVVRSATIMKTAVNHLKPSLSRPPILPKILLATVKGDVHDIGRNLVEIMFSNQGFEVIDLGIRVDPAQLIAAAKLHRPVLIGLSGLLVQSAHEMVTAARELKAAGLDIPIMVGGAALSQAFVDERIAPVYGGAVFYARDPIAALGFAKSLAITAASS